MKLAGATTGEKAGEEMGERVNGGMTEKMNACTARESREGNDAFYVCSLIEHIARRTQKRSSDVVRRLGAANIANLCEFADTYHCENIDDVADRFIAKAGIERGDFDNVKAARYIVPSIWDIGKVFKRLALGISTHDGVSVPEAIVRAYSSFVADKIEDYNSAFYYDAPKNILNAYVYGRVEP